MIFISVFYIQSNILTNKVNLKNPTFKRIRKSLRISILLFLWSFFFGVYGYFCLGDNFTNDLFMLRKSIGGKFEIIYQIILALFAIFMMLYISFFNISFKN